jgi:hypothetical protein
LVQKSKKFPLDASFAEAFFKLWVVAAYNKLADPMIYVEKEWKKVPFYQSLKLYLKEHFIYNGRINKCMLVMIGNLLLCGAPDWFVRHL